MSYVDNISQRGFAILPNFLDSDTISDVFEALANADLANNAGQRSGKAFGIRNLLNLVPFTRDLANSSTCKSLIEPILGPNARVVRGIYFDKHKDANWKVAWHQDLTIAVRERNDVATHERLEVTADKRIDLATHDPMDVSAHEGIDVALRERNDVAAPEHIDVAVRERIDVAVRDRLNGYGPWSVKAGIHHVQPPASVLENMLTLRIHLDHTDETNGGLRVLPGTHRHGRLDASQIEHFKHHQHPITCTVPLGGALLMRPLLLHSSTTAPNPSHRRVLHFEYSSADLPSGLKWFEQNAHKTAY